MNVQTAASTVAQTSIPVGIFVANHLWTLSDVAQGVSIVSVGLHAAYLLWKWRKEYKERQKNDSTK